MGSHEMSVKDGTWDEEMSQRKEVRSRIICGIYWGRAGGEAAAGDLLEI